MEKALQIVTVVIFGLIVFPVDGEARSFLFFPWILVSLQAFSLPVCCSNKNEARKMENRGYVSAF